MSRPHIATRIAACLALTIGAAATISTPASAAPAPSFDAQVAPYLADVDFDNGLILLVNTTRDEFCTDEMIDWENSARAWLDSGQLGEPPAFPGFSPANTLTATVTPVAQHNYTARWSDDVLIELWAFDSGVFPDHIGTGPCTDSDEDGHLIAAGTARWKGQDNDFWLDGPDLAGPRTDTVKDTISAPALTGPDGDYSYKVVIQQMFRDATTVETFRWLHFGFKATLRHT